MNSETSWVTLSEVSLSFSSCFFFFFNLEADPPLPPPPYPPTSKYIYNHIYNKTHICQESNEHTEKTHLYISSIIRGSIKAYFENLRLSINTYNTSHQLISAHLHTTAIFLYTPKVYLKYLTVRVLGRVYLKNDKRNTFTAHLCIVMTCSCHQYTCKNHV